MNRRIRHLFRCLIRWSYRLGHVGQDGRRGTFTGQCCQPLCSSETVTHLQEPSAITASPQIKSQHPAQRAIHRPQDFGQVTEPRPSCRPTSIPLEPSSPGPSAATHC